MKLLAIDSSTAACSVALLSAASPQGRPEVVEQFELSPRQHTQRLLPMVDSLLSDTGVALTQLDAIAYARGPGSFTGLRICMATVQGLAFGADIPVVAVSTLAALAQTGFSSSSLSSGQQLLCALDARMDEVYWGVYQCLDGLAVTVEPDQLSSPEQLHYAADNWSGIGSGWCYAARMPCAKDADRIIEDMLPRASAVALLGRRAFSEGNYCRADQAMPVYLRDQVAWQKTSG